MRKTRHITSSIVRSYRSFLAIILTALLTLIVAPPVVRADEFRGYWIGGRIYESYVRNGGFPRLGNALIPESDDARGGRFQHFAAGSSIYWNRAVTEPMAYLVGGRIRDRWKDAGWEVGSLGYPITDEKTSPDGIGKFNFFEKGAIYWHPSTGARIVWGQIYETWAGNGHERGFYGYPTSEEYDIPEGKAQNFQGGVIEWKQYGYPGDWEEDPSYVTSDQDGDASSVGIYAQPQPIQSADRLGRSSEKPLAVTDSTTQGCDTLPTNEPGSTCIERRVVEAPEAARSAEPTTSTEVSQPAVSSPLSSTVEIPAEEGQASSNAESPTDKPAISPSTSAIPATTLADSEYPTRQDELRDTSDPDVSRAATPSRSWCTSQWRGGTAFACKRQRVIYELKQVDSSGRLIVIGSITGDEYRDVLPDWKSLNTSMRYSFSVTAVAGAAAGASMEASATCQAGGCTSDAPNARVIVQPGVELYGLWNQNVDMPDNSKESRDLRVNIIVNKTGAYPSAHELGMTTIRCDSMGDRRARKGCRVWGVTPVFSMINSGPAMLRHMRAAKAAGLPGFVGGPKLPRQTRADEIRWNREYSCGRVTGPRPAGMDCDEYPFAATSYPRLASGLNVVTFSWCGIRDAGVVIDPTQSNNNASVCLLPSSENRRAGAQLGWFYVKARVHQDDLFWVSVDDAQ